MKTLKSLLGEIHRRYLWQSLLIYVLVAIIAYKVSQQIAISRGLPLWFVDVAVLLLIFGLPIVLTTAAVQEGIPTIGRSDPSLKARATAGGKKTSERRGVRRLFTWRNAIVGGVAAFTLWAIVAAGWLLLAEDLVSEASTSSPGEAVVDSVP